MLESRFKKKLKQDLEELYPGCMFINVDATTNLRSMVDLIMLTGPYWAGFETKRSSVATKQSNQDYYVDLLDKMSFCAFVSPENKEEILDALVRSIPTP